MKDEPWISQKDLRIITIAAILTIIPIIIFATMVLQKTNEILYQEKVEVQRADVKEKASKQKIILSLKNKKN